jgi:DNA recombination protein RmuC
MSTSFNALSTGVTKDMTEALTKVDEKVGILINKYNY